MFHVMNLKFFNTDEKVQDPNTNVALKKTAIASSQEAESVKSSKCSRWKYIIT